MKLSNVGDRLAAERGLLDPRAVRALEVEAVADTGAIGLVVPEEVVQALDLPVIRYAPAQTSDGRTQLLPVVTGIFLELLDRSMSTDAFVVPRGAKVLLGAVQLEWLDLVVVPKTQEVIANPLHPNGPEGFLLRVG